MALCVSSGVPGAKKAVSCFTYQATNQPGRETEERCSLFLSVVWMRADRGEWRITERERRGERGEDQSKKYDPLSPQNRTDPLPLRVWVGVDWTKQQEGSGRSCVCVCWEIDNVSQRLFQCPTFASEWETLMIKRKREREPEVSFHWRTHPYWAG